MTTITRLGIAFAAIVLLLIVMSRCSHAQPAPTPQGPTSYTLTLTPAEIDIVGTGLQEMPFKTASPLIQRILQQIQAQQAEFVKAHATPLPPEKPAQAEPEKKQ